jgi:exonuclease SbcC
MLIKQLRLKNIRSYLDETVVFPESSTLLAGEIGSGKSSILLAIEFALFGITRGVLSGTSLLRLGEAEGSVELHFSIEEKDIIIKRTLKRSKDEVRQDAGYIIINNSKQDCTPVELKSLILDLLGYPRQLLTKSKSLIYRYTVYTPQEQMKQILLEEGEARLDTLRRLFQIDKYQRIRENTIVLLRELKLRQSSLKGQLVDLDDKERRLQQLDTEISIVEKELSILLPKLSAASSKIKDKQSQLKAKEQQVKELSELKSNLSSITAQLSEKFSQLKATASEIETLKTSLLLLQQKASQAPAEPLENEVELESKLKTAETSRESLLKQKLSLESDIQTQNSRIKEQQQSLADISSLKKCPTCLQNVTPDHIHNIKSDQDSKISAYNTIIHQAQSKLSPLTHSLADSDQQILALKQSIRRLNQLKLQQQDRKNTENLIKEKQEHSLQLETRTKDLKREIAALNTSKLELEPKLLNLSTLEKEHDSLKLELESLERSERLLLVDTERIKSTKDSLTKNKSSLESEIKEKKQAKDELITLAERQNWLQVIFANLMTLIEQHVMMRVYNEFNDIFQEYFSTLLEDASLSVTLDDSFTPKIEQNGYDIYYEDLSGGEKTSIALAYRLALNRVINDLIDTIKTKDIIILDEPTDGFSTEQLDKLRTVLENLNTKQTIIVSHESKIESFVENIIRISKREHTSSISS